MTSKFETVAWIIAVVAFIPAFIVMGGFVVAGAMAVAVLGGYYGGRYGLRLYEQQNVGKKAGRFDLNSTLNGKDDDRDWGRDQ